VKKIVPHRDHRLESRAGLGPELDRGGERLAFQRVGEAVVDRTTDGPYWVSLTSLEFGDKTEPDRNHAVAMPHGWAIAEV